MDQLNAVSSLDNPAMIAARRSGNRSVERVERGAWGKREINLGPMLGGVSSGRPLTMRSIRSLRRTSPKPTTRGCREDSSPSRPLSPPGAPWPRTYGPCDEVDRMPDYENVPAGWGPSSGRPARRRASARRRPLAAQAGAGAAECMPDLQPPPSARCIERGGPDCGRSNQRRSGGPFRHRTSDGGSAPDEQAGSVDCPTAVGAEAFGINVVPEDVLPRVAAIHRATHGARMLDTRFARPGAGPSRPAKVSMVRSQLCPGRRRGPSRGRSPPGTEL
jgi:hypothetical protein